MTTDHGYRIRPVAGGYAYVVVDATGYVVARSMTFLTVAEAVEAAEAAGGPFPDALVYEPG